MNHKIISATQRRLTERFPNTSLYHQVGDDLSTTRLLGVDKYDGVHFLPIFIVYQKDVVYYLDDDCNGFHINYAAPNLFERLANAVVKNLARLGETTEACLNRRGWSCSK